MNDARVRPFASQVNARLWRASRLLDALQTIPHEQAQGSDPTAGGLFLFVWNAGSSFYLPVEGLSALPHAPHRAQIAGPVGRRNLLTSAKKRGAQTRTAWLSGRSRTRCSSPFSVRGST